MLAEPNFQESPGLFQFMLSDQLFGLALKLLDRLAQRDSKAEAEDNHGIEHASIVAKSPGEDKPQAAIPSRARVRSRLTRRSEPGLLILAA